MRILALETSTEYCSVALWQDGELSGRCELAGQKHSEMLIAMIDGVLREAGVTLAQCDGIAYGSGPGSFTGVRIACGAAQGLALGSGLPVFGVCTLQALAEDAGHDRVIAALDARMGEIYVAAYERAGDGWIAVCEPMLCKPEQAPALPGQGWFGAGSGFAAFAVLQQRYAAQLAGLDAGAIPQARAIAASAAALLAKGGGMDAAQAQPFYLRDKVAFKTAERELMAAAKSR